MRVSEIYAQRKLTISVELFPPKTPEAKIQLFEKTIPEVSALSPAFMTCTYGAGGSTRGQTLEIVSRLKNEYGVEAALHLTCVGASRGEIADYVEKASLAGVSNIVALRGDPPQGDATFKAHPDGYKFAVELVSFLKSTGKFDLLVAGYPEGHPECPTRQLDWQHCAEKVAVGASGVVTQIFYDNRYFLEFADYLRNKLGVTVPVVPGVLPILNAAQVRRFCSLCKATIPSEIMDRLDRYGDDKESARKYGVEVATRMCDELIRHGVPGIHFYALNRSDSIREVMRNLQLVPSE